MTDLDLGLQYADTMNLARGILDSTGVFLEAQDAAERATENAQRYGDFEPVVSAWDRLLQARATAQAWCEAYTSRGYVRDVEFPLTPCEVPT